MHETDHPDSKKLPCRGQPSIFVGEHSSLLTRIAVVESASLREPKKR
jgi:hypothetical protein